MLVGERTATCVASSSTTACTTHDATPSGLHLQNYGCATGSATVVGANHTCQCIPLPNERPCPPQKHSSSLFPGPCGSNHIALSMQLQQAHVANGSGSCLEAEPPAMSPERTGGLRSDAAAQHPLPSPTQRHGHPQHRCSSPCTQGGYTPPPQ
jgi:hypothetical protein